MKQLLLGAIAVASDGFAFAQTPAYPKVIKERGMPAE